jgi:dTDP-4-amino-4,6-dideoxygalactose transaminase
MTGQKQIFLQRPNVGKDEIDLITQVIESKYLVEGPMVKEFEQTVANYVKTKNAIACTSATTGIELALRVLNTGKGDEVIVPDFTHPATALVVMAVGAEPILVDVDIETRNIDDERIEEAITDKTKAVIPVSIFGNPLEIDSINDLRDKHGIQIIEDAACSLGSEIDGRKVGSLTDITVFSFHPRKIFTTGDGGLITTDDDEWAELITSMKKFGSGKTNDGKPGFIRLGTNYRMSDIHGAVALGQVRRLKEIIDNRREKARIYDELLENVNDVMAPIIKPNAKSNYQTYAVYLEVDGIRDKVISEMKKKNIQTQIGTYALHTQTVFKNVKKVGDLQNSYKLYKNLLALPLHHELTFEDQERVVKELKICLSALSQVVRIN